MGHITRARATIITAIAGFAVVLTALPTWVKGSAPTATGDTPVSVSGTTASPTTASVGLVIIAAALVLGLAGRVMRRVALVVAIAGVFLAGASVVGVLRNPAPALTTAAAEVTSVRAISTPPQLSLWPYISVAVLVSVGVLCVWLLTSLGRWGQVASKYRLASRSPSKGEGGEEGDTNTSQRMKAIEDWDAITRGEDPT